MIDFGHLVRLARIERKDLPTIRRWRNDERIWKWCRQRDLIDELAHEAWFERQSQDPTISMFKMVSLVAGIPDTMVGVCGLTDIDLYNRRAEFSLYVAPDYQVRGFAKSALKTLFSHGFRSLGLNLIWGETFDGNPAAGLFERLGMTLEGTRRAFYFKDGRFVDCHIYSVQACEWKYER